MEPNQPVLFYAEYGQRLEAIHYDTTGRFDKAIALLRQGFERTTPFAGIQRAEDAVLILFNPREDNAHREDKLVRLVQIPLYVEEVKPFQPLGEADLREREEFTRQTGFLLFGPDECFAALRTGPNDYVFTDCYEVNTSAVPRSLAGYYAHNVDHKAQVTRIADLHITRTRELIQEIQGEIYWWGPQTKVFDRTQMQRHQRSVELLRAHLDVAPPERTASGAVIHRSFIQNGDTGSTLAMRPSKEGWVRYPTSQDAWYYGVWICPPKRELLTYAEQDVTHTVCDTDAQFRAELKALSDFHGKDRKPSVYAIEPGMSTAMFETLFLNKHAVDIVTFNADSEAKDKQGKWIVPLFCALQSDHPSVQSLRDNETKQLPTDAFEMDWLDPLAFTDWKAFATGTTTGLRIKLVWPDGHCLEADHEIRESVT